MHNEAKNLKEQFLAYGRAPPQGVVATVAY
jgi:hypothetical protein